MRGSIRLAFAALAIGALLGVLAAPAAAGTIIKLSLGDDANAPDITFNGAILSTANDGGPGTGDQQTNVEFLDFLSGETDITDGSGSFSLSGLAVNGPAQTFGGFLVIQNFLGGTFNLYNGANTLLLSGALDASTLTGPIGPPATGALFTTTFGSITGGTLAPQIQSDTMTLAITFTSINNGAGFGVSGVAPNQTLNSFTADASVIIAADPIPEPATMALALLGMFAAGTCCCRRVR